MTITPIVVVEDRGILGLSVSEYLRQDQAALEPYELHGTIQVLASMRALRNWLYVQPARAVRLLLLDVPVFGGISTTILTQLRDPARERSGHLALHSETLIIGWSADANSEQVFQEAHADGFISKDRPVTQITADIVTIAQQRQSGARWVTLRSPHG